MEDSDRYSFVVQIPTREYNELDFKLLIFNQLREAHGVIITVY